MANLVVLLSTIIPASIVVILFSTIVILYYKKKREFLERLREYPIFEENESEISDNLKIQYAEASDVNLKKLKEKYNLTLIAGEGTEIEQIINVMKWVHMLARRSHNPPHPGELNALNIINKIETEQLKLNCFFYSTIMNEVLLALGIKSRKMHLRPHKRIFKESHYVVEVFSKSLNKWILFDPDFCTYSMDENNNILNILELRNRLIQNKIIKINKEKEYNVGGLLGFLVNPLKRKTYLWYISKNIFRFETALHSVFDYDSKGKNREYLEVMPSNYFSEELHSEPTIRGTLATFHSTNSKLLW